MKTLKRNERCQVGTKLGHEVGFGPVRRFICGLVLPRYSSWGPVVPGWGLASAMTKFPHGGEGLTFTGVHC